MNFRWQLGVTAGVDSGWQSPAATGFHACRCVEFGLVETIVRSLRWDAGQHGGEMHAARLESCAWQEGTANGHQDGRHMTCDVCLVGKAKDVHVPSQLELAAGAAMAILTSRPQPQRLKSGTQHKHIKEDEPVLRPEALIARICHI